MFSANTYSFLFSLQEVEGSCTLDAREEPYRVAANQSLEQADITEGIATFTTATNFTASCRG
jgi:hypothetical protein